MSENTNPTAPVTFKLTTQEVATQLQSYLSQADQSLQQLQTNIDSGSRQLEEWKKMQLVLVGQRQVVVDLLTKLVDRPSAPEASSSSTTATT